MSSVISENVQITVMENELKKAISLSVNDYCSNGGVIGVYIQLSYKQAQALIDLLNEKVPKHV